MRRGGSTVRHQEAIGKDDVISLFSEDERTQLRRDRLAIEARLRRIPEEKERERQAIEDRHSGLVEHTFPIAVILLVPESLATMRKP